MPHSLLFRPATLRVDLSCYDRDAFVSNGYDVNGRAKMANIMIKSSIGINVKNLDEAVKSKCVTKVNSFRISATERSTKSKKHQLLRTVPKDVVRSSESQRSSYHLRGVKRNRDEEVHLQQTTVQSCSKVPDGGYFGIEKRLFNQQTRYCDFDCKCNFVEEAPLQQHRKQFKFKQKSLMRGKESSFNKIPSTGSRKKVLCETQHQRSQLNHGDLMEVSSLMFKKLQKEHLLLKRSFTTLLQTVNEAASPSQRPFSIVQQKEALEDQVDGLNRQIELLSLELQEARDQNELMEFRILELEQCQVKVICTKCPELEKQLAHATDQNLKLTQRLEEVSVRTQQELNDKYLIIKEEGMQNFDHKNNNQTINDNASDNDQSDGQMEDPVRRMSIASNVTKTSESDPGYQTGYAMTSEDEGLGDDTRRDNTSSGPSSLADLHESEYDVLSVQSTNDMHTTDTHNNESELQVGIERLASDEVCTQIVHANKHDRSVGRSVKGSSGQANVGCQQVSGVSSQTDGIVLATSEQHLPVDCQGYVKQLELSLARLKEEKANLEEQVLELEEAENDARLMSQRLERRVEILLNQYQDMRIELIDVKKTIDLNRSEINAIEQVEIDLRAQINMITSDLLKYQADASHNDTSVVDTRISEGKHQDLVERIATLEKEDKNLQDQLFQVDDLNTVLWEKLYALESQIDTFKDTFGDGSYKESVAGGETVKEVVDDDLQLFVSADRIAQHCCASNVGSSFDVTRFDKSLHQHSSATNRLDDLVLSLPLCETVKPERIDVMMNSPTNAAAAATITTSTTNELSSEMMDRIRKLEANEQQLKDKLLQLEWINKEFVRELELREKIFVEKQQQHNDWCRHEEELRKTIQQLQAERNELSVKVSELEAEKNNLLKQIEAHRSAMEEKKKDYERELLETQHEQNNIVTNMLININQLEGSTQELVQRIDCLEMQEHREIQQLVQLKNNHAALKEELNQERENVIKLKKDFTDQLNNLISYHTAYQDELKQRIDDLQIQESDYSTRIQSLIEQETSLKQLLDDKENQLIKLQQTHINRIKILEEEHGIVEKELNLKMQLMEEKTKMTVKELETERCQIQRELEETIIKYKEKELVYVQQINDLRETVNKLESKVDKLETERSESLHLREEISLIKANEEIVRGKLNEMKQKESAYEETLAKADKIIATLEREYKERIEELEKSERNLKSKVNQLEECEWKRMKRRPGQVSDLVQQLIDSEAKECALRDQITNLENSERQKTKKIEELSNRLESEIRDHEELLATVVDLQQEIESLKKDLSKSLQTQDSLQDMIKETEKYCEEREEEMYKKYKLLEDKKCQLEITIQELGHRLRQSESRPNSYDTLSLFSDSNCCRLELSPSPSYEFDEPTQELTTACLNMEKCLKRAMVVVQMEINEKDQLDKPGFEESEHPFSSFSSLSPCSSDSDKCEVQKYNDPELNVDRSEPIGSFDKPGPPTNFRIIRQVGSDALLVGWQSQKKDILGYEIMVNDITLQKVRNADATKALLHKLDLSKPLCLSITTISYYDVKSEPLQTWYHPNAISAN